MDGLSVDFQGMLWSPKFSHCSANKAKLATCLWYSHWTFIHSFTVWKVRKACSKYIQVCRHQMSVWRHSTCSPEKSMPKFVSSWASSYNKQVNDCPRVLPPDIPDSWEHCFQLYEMIFCLHVKPRHHIPLYLTHWFPSLEILSFRRYWLHHKCQVAKNLWCVLTHSVSVRFSEESLLKPHNFGADISSWHNLIWDGSFAVHIG